jgi:hypothetical protein
LSERDSTLVRGGLPNAMVIMTIMRVPLVMSDGDGMDFNTQAPAASHAWAHVAVPVVPCTKYCADYFILRVEPSLVLKALRPGRELKWADRL